MIEIIKPGYKKYKGQCFTCNAEFTYELEDIADYVVQCPCCNRPVSHYPDDFVRGSEIVNNK